MTSDFATPEDVHSARPDVPLQTIRRHCRDGVIPGAVKFGRSWIVPMDSAVAYVKTYRRYARTEEGAGASPLETPAPTDPPQDNDQEMCDDQH